MKSLKVVKLMWRALLFLIVLLGSAAIVTAVSGLMYLIFLQPAPHLDRENIRQLALNESVIYYRDGKTKLGGFYEGAHRNYLEIPSPLSISSSYQDLVPPLFIKAIIASEDKDFYAHPGISVMGIIRAMIANLKAGHIVQGASTLTQQTSGLLFEYKAAKMQASERWRAKLMEMLDAFRLEARYSKDQILEFYTNLFHVHGTGQGLAIAARYYFNKEVTELTLADIAFIAGSVKGPANYNPFRTADAKRIEAIKKKARERRDYVLGNMLEMGFITQDEFQEAIKSPVDFRQGSFGFEHTYQTDTVRTALEAPLIKKALEAHNIEDLSRAEVSIYTTLDAPLQEEADFILKRHLSQLEFRISKYAAPDETPLSPTARPRMFEFYVGQISQVVDKGSPSVTVKLGRDNGIVEGVFIEDFVRDVLRLNPGDKVTPAQYQKALAFLKVNDPILVSVHQQKSEGWWTIGIEKRPQLNGALFILQDGELRAFSGGFANFGFNRALAAKRQPGSTFKLLVYLAALHLGWNPLEPLPNLRQTYTFQGQYYFPKPDHEPEDAVTSIVWAGAKSENLASVYLLDHLLNHLNLDQFKEIMKFVGLAPLPNETRSNYQTRLRDKYGIFDLEKNLYTQTFDFARRRLKQELLINAPIEELYELDRLFYGEGWQEAYEKMADPNKPQYKDRELLRVNFLRMREVAQNVPDLTTVQTAFNTEEAELLKELDPSLLIGLAIKPAAAGRATIPPLAYSPSEGSLSVDWKPLTRDKLELYQKFWETGLRSQFLQPSNIWIEGKVRQSTLNALQTIHAQVVQETQSLPSYSAERLFRHRDFRLMVSLQLLIKLAKTLGVESELLPVLSFPLGSNEVTLGEVALMYQTYVTGDIFINPGQSQNNTWKLIDRIEDAKGNLIYQSQLERHKILPPETSRDLREVLRSVVEYGTARTAKPFLVMKQESTPNAPAIRLPAYGKTGTANNYSNATYVGFLPTIQGVYATTTNGYTIASYVGLDRLDDDETKIPFKLTGSVGALPGWAQLANFLINTPEYRKQMDWKQLPLLPQKDVLLFENPDNHNQTVSVQNGLPLEPGSAEKTATVYLPPPPLPNEERTVHLFPEIQQLGAEN